MRREKAIETIKQLASCKDYLKKSPKGNYICPFCGSGTGPNKSGAVEYYENTNSCFCFSCKKRFDVIDLEMNNRGCDFNTALSLLADSLSIAIDSYNLDSEAARLYRAQRDFMEPVELQDRAANNQQPAAQAPDPQPEQQADYTEYYKVCRARLQQSPEALKYLETRGISAATAAAYWLGYDPAADPCNAPGAMDSAGKKYPTPRIILPSTKSHYVGRALDDNVQPPKPNCKGSTPGIFNSCIFNNPAEQPAAVFVTEGIFDALSIIEAGGPAIALNSTSNVNKLLNKLAAYPTTATLILSLDDDPGGRKATEELIAGLLRLNISYITADLLNGCKDPNAALVKDKDKFYAAVSEAQRKTSVRPDCTSFYLDHFMQTDIELFNNSRRSTGFKNLDNESGGLYAGLYVIAALPSLGKTTFALQLADQLAAAGTDILFFSLEQSKFELVSKSLARTMAQQDKSTAINSIAIRAGDRTSSVKEAAAKYKQEIGDRVSIIQGDFNCDIDFICNYTRDYIRKTKTQPVVFVDYLQILQPAADPFGRQQSLRESVDTALTTMKRLSRELNITVILISSVNRGNYMTPVDFESLKESGGIEYTADVVWGLQFQCLRSDKFDSRTDTGIKEKRAILETERNKEPRSIELVGLKNRFGKARSKLYFHYYAGNDLYVETDNLDPEWQPAKESKKAGNKK